MYKLIYIGIALWLFITGFAQQQRIALSPSEKNAILLMREEEKLARDVYDSLYMKWEGNPFGNIRRSEQTHMDLMKSLVTTYGLSDPVDDTKDAAGVFVNALLQKYFNEMVAAGSQSFVQALQTGARIEELDIHDLKESMEHTKQPDILFTYRQLRMASENHLRAFVRRLKMAGVDYQPVILGKEAFETIVSTGNNGQGRRGNFGN